MSARGDVSPQSQLATSATQVPVWLFVSGDGDAKKGRPLSAAGVRMFTKPGPSPCYAARDILGMLADEGITRLLVEGGPGMWRLFAPVADEVVVFKAGCGPLAIHPLTSLGPDGVDKSLLLASVRRIGDDQVFVYRRS